MRSAAALSGSDDRCAVLLAVVGVPVVNVVLELCSKLVNLVGLAGERRHIGVLRVAKDSSIVPQNRRRQFPKRSHSGVGGNEVL